MVNKTEKSREVTLARGPILPSELASVLATAWDGATGLFNDTVIVWADRHSASIRSLDDLEPIEDAQGIAVISGRFQYEDKSSLEISLSRYENNTVKARGGTARQRQSAIAQQWATFPGRGRLSQRWASLAWSYSIGPILCAILFLLTGAFDAGSRTSPLSWTIRIGFLLIAVWLNLALWATPSVRAQRNLIVLDRRATRPMADAWTIASGVLGAIALAVAVVTYFIPRK